MPNLEFSKAGFDFNEMKYEAGQFPEGVNFKEPEILATYKEEMFKKYPDIEK